MEVVSLKNETTQEKNAVSVVSSEERTMTQQIIALLEEVEGKHQGGKSETKTEDDSMESGSATSISKRSERCQTLSKVRRVLGKVGEYVDEEERRSFVLWWSNNDQVLTGINSTAVDKDRLMVTYLNKDACDALLTIENIRRTIAKEFTK